MQCEPVKLIARSSDTLHPSPAFNSTSFISSRARSTSQFGSVTLLPGLNATAVLTPALLQIWDLRTGAISDTIRYEHPITGLQFDSRKIVAAAGENGVRVSHETWHAHNRSADGCSIAGVQPHDAPTHCAVGQWAYKPR